MRKFLQVQTLIVRKRLIGISDSQITSRLIVPSEVRLHRIEERYIAWWFGNHGRIRLNNVIAYISPRCGGADGC